MATFRSLASRLSALFRKSEWDERVDEELEFHIGMETEENIRRGMTPLDARAAALRKLGNKTAVREDVHHMNTILFLDETLRNIRISLRTLRKNPGFALTAVLVLALGLGSATATFSALDRILFRPLPYADAGRLVSVGMTFQSAEHPEQSEVLLPSGTYQEHWKPAPKPFTAVTAIRDVGDTCDVTEQQPERLLCTSVEGNFLQTFGVRPALGRDFTPEDDLRGAPPVVIISHAVWTRRFGADAGAIGRSLDLNGRAVRVIAVLPAGFAMPAVEADILRPLQLYPLDPKDSRSFLTAFGRLKSGVTPEQAETAIAPIVEADTKGSGGVRPGCEATTCRPRVTPLRDYLVGDASRVAWLLLAAVGGLLLIACVNVANLILARLATRDREFAVRSALGAGRARLARMALTESLLLAAGGGGLGLLFADAVLQIFVRLAPSSIPEIGQASIDLRVFAVATALAVAAGTAVGLWPALSVLRSRALQYGARATAAAQPRMRFTLVTVQIALTVAMLASSSLLLRSLWKLVAVPLGYQSERVITMSVTPTVGRYPGNSPDRFFERLLDGIRNTPGTTTVTMTSAAAPSGVTLAGMMFPVDRQPRDSRPPGQLIRVREVTPGYFQTLGIPILRGRAFAEADLTDLPAVILSESAAQSLFPGQNPIGHTVRLPQADEWAEVVGVAGDVRNTGPVQASEPELYIPWRPNGITSFSDTSTAYFAIRTKARTADAISFLKTAVADLDPQIPVTIEPLDLEVFRLTERPRFIAWLLSAFTGLALLLASAGLYGVASYLVTQRTRDFGVRMALGAAPADISWQVVGEAVRWIGAGVVLGCALAWAVTRTIEAQLFEVGLGDPLSWIAAIAVLCTALLLAVLRPAARAARVDPMEALRAD